MIRNATPGVSDTPIQLLRVVSHVARIEDTNAAVSEWVEAVFPVEGEKREQAHVVYFITISIDSRYILRTVPLLPTHLLVSPRTTA
jgi:hypothetical protein